MTFGYIDPGVLFAFVSGVITAFVLVITSAFIVFHQLPLYIAPSKLSRPNITPTTQGYEEGSEFAYNAASNLTDPHLGKCGWVRISSELLTDDELFRQKPIAMDISKRQEDTAVARVDKDTTLLKLLQASGYLVSSATVTVKFLVARFMGHSASSPFQDQQQSSRSPNASTVNRPPQWRNVFAILRYKSLTFYADSDCLEKVQEISLPQYQPRLFPPHIANSEMYNCMNPIMLEIKRAGLSMLGLDGHTSLDPLFVYAPTGSDKEDWFIMMRRASQLPRYADSGALSVFFHDSEAMRAYTDAMSKLIKNTSFNSQATTIPSTLASTSSQNDTAAWLNALIGRAFIAIHSNPNIKSWLIYRLTRHAIQKPASPPSLLGDIIIQNIDVGNSLPLISNPQLLNISTDGDMNLQVDIDYSGGIRVEASTLITLKIPSLDAHIKPLVLPITLAVKILHFSARLLLKIKPFHESNRLWFGFFRHPELKLKLQVEPIISSKLVRVQWINLMIERRIKQVLEDSFMLPNMDDLCFWPFDNDDDSYQGRDTDSAERAEDVNAHNQVMHSELDAENDKSVELSMDEVDYFAQKLFWDSESQHYDEEQENEDVINNGSPSEMLSRSDGSDVSSRAETVRDPAVSTWLAGEAVESNMHTVDRVRKSAEGLDQLTPEDILPSSHVFTQNPDVYPHPGTTKDSLQGPQTRSPQQSAAEPAQKDAVVSDVKMLEVFGNIAYNLGLLTRQYHLDKAAAKASIAVKNVASSIGLKTIDALGLAPDKNDSESGTKTPSLSNTRHMHRGAKAKSDTRQSAANLTETLPARLRSTISLSVAGKATLHRDQSFQLTTSHPNDECLGLNNQSQKAIPRRLSPNH
eukprot:jgi/Hompol1/1435/HPOL_005596-RA